MTDVRMTQRPILRRGSSVAMNVMNPGNIDAQPTAEMMMMFIPGRRQKKIRGRERGKKRKPHVIGRGLRAVGKQEAGAPAARKARSTRGRPPRARSAPRPWPSTCWHWHPPVRGLATAKARHATTARGLAAAQAYIHILYAPGRGPARSQPRGAVSPASRERRVPRRRRGEGRATRRGCARAPAPPAARAGDSLAACRAECTEDGAMGCGASTQRHPDKAAEEEEAKRKAAEEVGWDLWMACVA